MPDLRDDPGLGDRGVVGQALPECGEHCGACARCGVEIKVKPRKRFEGEARRKRKVISIRVPDDEEDGAAIWDETLEDVKDRLVREGLKDRPEDLSVYVALVAALRDWLNG